MQHNAQSIRYAFVQLLLLVLIVSIVSSAPLDKLPSSSMEHPQLYAYQPGYPFFSGFLWNQPANGMNRFADPEERLDKRSAAVARPGFRPSKRSVAVGRAQFRPAKRTVARGRVGFRPAKRFNSDLTAVYPWI